MRLYSDGPWLDYDDVALIHSLDVLPVEAVSTGVKLGHLNFSTPIFAEDQSSGEVLVLNGSVQNSMIIDYVKSGKTVGIFCGAVPEPEWIQSKIFAGVSFLVLYGTNFGPISARDIKEIKFLFPDLYLIVGPVASWDSFLYLSQSGSDAIIVSEGYWNVPLLSTIMDIYEKSERWGLSTSIIAEPAARSFFSTSTIFPVKKAVTLLAAGAEAIYLKTNSVRSWASAGGMIAQAMAELGAATVADLPLVTEYVVKK